MFDPKAEVPSLELCQRLKELGFPQEGDGFYWIFKNNKWQVVYLLDNSMKRRLKIQTKNDAIKAPTYRELRECLKDRKIKIERRIVWQGKDSELFYADTKPNAYTKVLIWLAENGYVKFERKEVEDEIDGDDENF